MNLRSFNIKIGIPKFSLICVLFSGCGTLNINYMKQESDNSIIDTIDTIDPNMDYSDNDDTVPFIEIFISGDYQDNVNELQAYVPKCNQPVFLKNENGIYGISCCESPPIMENLVFGYCRKLNREIPNCILHLIISFNPSFYIKKLYSKVNDRGHVIDNMSFKEKFESYLEEVNKDLLVSKNKCIFICPQQRNPLSMTMENYVKTKKFETKIICTTDDLCLWGDDCCFYQFDYTNLYGDKYHKLLFQGGSLLGTEMAIIVGVLTFSPLTIIELNDPNICLDGISIDRVNSISKYAKENIHKLNLIEGSSKISITFYDNKIIQGTYKHIRVLKKDTRVLSYSSLGPTDLPSGYITVKIDDGKLMDIPLDNIKILKKLPVEYWE